MLGWIKSLWGSRFNVIDDLKKFFLGVISAVYSYFDNLISQVWNEVVAAWNEAVNLYNIAIRYAQQIYTILYSAFWQTISDVERWVSGIASAINDFINRIVLWASSEINRLWSWAWSEILALEKWVITNIWDPIVNSIRGIISWVMTYGTFAFYMVTHPDRLAALLAGWILHEWTALSHRYGPVAARWMLHSMLRAGSTVAGILENILVAIL